MAGGQSTANIERVTVRELHSMKQRGEKVALLTAYDYPFALIEDVMGVDVILVGDSLGMTVLGHDTTLSVDMDEMLNHTGAVVKGTKRAMVIADMPFMSFQTSVADAVRNAGRFLSQAGAQGVKIEGGVKVKEKAKAIVDAGIPLLGHVGLTPQSIRQYGGFMVQGKTAEEAKKIVDDAKAVAEAGAFAIIAESIPSDVTQVMREAVPVPIYGIGAGPCDGQILVIHDLLGLFDKFLPKFAKRYADVSAVVKQAVQEYIQDVKAEKFPSAEHQFCIKKEELDKLKRMLKS
jgi:3-methyl-2-oxobutanoate hydroxymethyltransferase